MHLLNKISNFYELNSPNRPTFILFRRKLLIDYGLFIPALFFTNLNRIIIKLRCNEFYYYPKTSNNI